MIPTVEQVLSSANASDFRDTVDRAVEIQNAGDDAGLSEMAVAALILADQLRIELQALREDIQDLRQAVRP